MTKQAWRLIKTHDEYEKGMDRLLELAEKDLIEGSDDFDEFELLNLLIGHYEENKYPIDKPDPIEAIKFRMDQQGLTQADMRQYIGSASKVSEVLNYRRPLSLSMIKRLHFELGIPADILLQDNQNIEWSSISYGAENFAVAFGDACKKLTDRPQKLINNGDYEEVANLHTSLTFSPASKSMNASVRDVINVASEFVSTNSIAPIHDFQRA